MRRAVAIVVSFVLVGPALLRAESLGDVAAREKKKKEGKPSSGKVITEADLGKRGRGTYNNPDDVSAGVPPDEVAPAPAAGGEKEKEKTTEDLRADAEKKYREDVKLKGDEIASIKTRISQIEGSGSYASPTAAAELEKLRNQLKAAEQALVDLEDQRRRAGIPR